MKNSITPTGISCVLLAAGALQTVHAQELIANGSLNPTNPLPTHYINTSPYWWDIPQFQAISSPNAEVIPSWHQRDGANTWPVTLTGENGDQRIIESSADIWGANGRWLPHYTSTQSAQYEAIPVTLSPDGGFFMGTGSLSFPSGTTVIEGIYQNLTGLQVGETYQVGFYSTNLNGRFLEYIDTYAPDSHDTYAKWMEGVAGTYSVLIDGVSAYSGLNNAYAYGSNQWEYNSFTFVAQESDIQLEIQGANPAAGSSLKQFYGGIDGVSLTQVPEPAAALLSILAFVPAAFRRRRC